MNRARFWLRWSWRDLRSRWLTVVAIAFVIAIGTGMYTGLGSMEEWRKTSNDASFASLRAHDLKIQLNEGGYVRQGKLRRLVGAVPGAKSIKAVNERLIVPVQAQLKRPGERPVLTPGQLVGMELGPRGSPTDAVSVETGRGLTARDSGRPTAVLEGKFGSYHQLPATGSLRLAGGQRLRYVGQGYSPEYFLVMKQGGGEFGGSEANFAVLFTSLRTAQRLAGGGPVVNDAVIRLRAGAGLHAVAGQLEHALRRARVAAEVTTLADEPAHRILYRDAEGDQALMNIFAWLVLAGAALATFNLASRIVEAQRREIGIGMALGVAPRELAIRPLLLGAEIALAGTVCGVGMGLFVGTLFRGVLADVQPLPVVSTPFETAIFIRGAAIGLLLPLVATAIPVWRGLRVEPIEAIRVGFRSAKSSGLARIGRLIRLPGSSIVQMPLRNVLRAPRRTVMTVLGIGAVVTVVVALLGMVDSFLTTIDQTEQEIGGATPARVEVSLTNYQRTDSRLVRSVIATPGAAAAEPRADVPVKLHAGSRSLDASIELLNARSKIWRPTITAGRSLAAAPNGIVISEKAAEDLHVGVGDRIKTVFPRRLGPTSFERASARLKVVGLHPNPFRGFAYMDRSRAPLMGLAGQANAVAIAPKPGASEAQLKRELFGVRGIAAVERSTASMQFVRKRINDFVGIFQFTEAFALLLALLIAFNSTSISVDERAREGATMLAFGMTVKEALGVLAFEGLIIGVLATVVGIAGGLAVLSWVVHNTLPNTIPDLGIQVTIGRNSLLITAVVGLVAVTLAPLLTARRIARMDVPSTLRVVE